MLNMTDPIERAIRSDFESGLTIFEIQQKDYLTDRRIGEADIYKITDVVDLDKLKEIRRQWSDCWSATIRGHDPGYQKLANAIRYMACELLFSLKYEARWINPDKRFEYTFKILTARSLHEAKSILLRKAGHVNIYRELEMSELLCLRDIYKKKVRSSPDKLLQFIRETENQLLGVIDNSGNVVWKDELNVLEAMLAVYAAPTLRLAAEYLIRFTTYPVGDGLELDE